MPAAAPRRRSVGLIVTIVLLAVFLAAALGGGGWLYLQLEQAHETIQQQDDRIRQQRELIDRKETFGAAMTELMQTVALLEGVTVGRLVDLERYQTLAASGWFNRWNAPRVDASTERVREATAELEQLMAAAEAEAASNASGSAYEEVLDRLGSGFVTTQLTGSDGCGMEAMACVWSNDPRTVIFIDAEIAPAHITDWIITGIAYHEFAHVLQYTHPEPTEVAAEAFGGDWESMADCFSLTYLDGWSLEHTVWVSSFQYWEVEVGYGYTCNEDQRQVIRDWYEQLGFQPQPVSQ